MGDVGVTKGRTSAYERATREYDPEFERAITTAVSEAIAQVSLVTDTNAMVLRTGEIIAALTAVLASTIALSPAITRSPTQIRKFLAENAKRLQRQTMQAANNPDVKGVPGLLLHQSRRWGARMTTPMRDPGRPEFNVGDLVWVEGCRIARVRAAGARSRYSHARRRQLVGRRGGRGSGRPRGLPNGGTHRRSKPRRAAWRRRWRDKCVSNRLRGRSRSRAIFAIFPTRLRR